MVVVRQYSKEGEDVFCIGYDATSTVDKLKGIMFIRLLGYHYFILEGTKTIKVRNKFATKEEAEAAIDVIHKRSKEAQEKREAYL